MKKEIDIMTEIEKLEDLSPTKIEKVDMGPNDILVVTVDCGKMRGNQVVKHLAVHEAEYRKVFPDNDIMVVSSRVDLSVLHMVENH